MEFHIDTYNDIINQPYLIQGLSLIITVFVTLIYLKVHNDAFKKLRELAIKDGNPRDLRRATKFQDNEEIVKLFVKNLLLFLIN